MFAVRYLVMVGVAGLTVTRFGKPNVRFGFLQVASTVLMNGGEVVSDWPQDSS